MKLNRLIIVLGIILVVIIGIQYLVSRRQITTPGTTIPTTTSAPKPVSLIIDYGDGQKSTHIRQFEATQSAFTSLQNIATEKEIPLVFKQYSFGVLVESINGYQNTPDLSWIYFVNSRSPEVGADQYQIQPGDTIEWKYIKPQY